MDLLIRQRSMLCAKTFHKVAGRVDAPVKGVADQEVKVAKAVDLAEADLAAKVVVRVDAPAKVAKAGADLEVVVVPVVRVVKAVGAVRYLSPGSCAFPIF